MWILCVSFASRANPWEDPTTALLERSSREQPSDLFLGAWDRSAITWSHRLSRFVLPPSVHEIVERELEAPLRLAREKVPLADAPLTLNSGWGISAGDYTPPLLEGDPRPGVLEGRFELMGLTGVGPWVGWFQPEFRADFVEPIPQSQVLLMEGWVGLSTPAVQAGFGLLPRTLGPARWGGLLLSDNARSFPLGSAAWQGRLPFRLGRFRAEAGVGWLQHPRNDLQNPGVLLMDLRYHPVPWVELGATRMSLFAGSGRPWPTLGQLLLPTAPHITDDPGQLQPDQDELASIDLRVLAPLRQWMGEGPVDFVELWWQYGAEDVIASEVFGVPYPALTGVAHLLGGRVAAGPLMVTGEGARVLDDRFRWYVGHRIYHEGFTQGGRTLGMSDGGDALYWAAEVQWSPTTWGVALEVLEVERVGVIDPEGDALRALLTEEIHHRLGVRAWHLHASRGWWQVRGHIERVKGAGFVPGEPEWRWYLGLER